MRELLQKQKEYLAYVEEHYLNVQKAWKELQSKCASMRFVYDDFVYGTIDSEVKNHDVSKLSPEEFEPYRQQFFPMKGEQQNKEIFKQAWGHHKKHNPHHWQNWTQVNYTSPYAWEIHCVHMVVDWVAMGYKFGDTARDYYESNKQDVNLPDYAVKFINEIFTNVYGEQK